MTNQHPLISRNKREGRYAGKYEYFPKNKHFRHKHYFLKNRLEWQQPDDFYWENVI